jgi:amino-acid N-acetyltransferase
MHRAASPGDIKEIKKILSFYCLETEKVGKNLAEFKVTVLNEKIVGCACLDVGDVVELRSIAVLPGYRNKGIGSQLADAVLDSAAKLTDTVYLRTSSPGFFEKKGAVRLGHGDKKIIWNDCAECDKFDICKQVLMKFNI